MKKYQVTVVREATGETIISVKAKTPQEAERLAIEKAKSQDISSHESRYFVTFVEKEREDDTTETSGSDQDS